MIHIGVNVIIRQQGRILLTQREDFEVWCLPGGHVDGRESAAQAAMREAREETGLEVALDRLVGVYSTPNWADGGAHIVSFSAHPVGGKLLPQPHEVIAIDWFATDELPEPLMWQHRQRIVDALAGFGGAVAWCQDLAWPRDAVNDRATLYEMRDQSGLSRIGFYDAYLSRPGPRGEVCEVGASDSASEA